MQLAAPGGEAGPLGASGRATRRPSPRFRLLEPAAFTAADSTAYCLLPVLPVQVREGKYGCLAPGVAEVEREELVARAEAQGQDVLAPAYTYSFVADVDSHHTFGGEVDRVDRGRGDVAEGKKTAGGSGGYGGGGYGGGGYGGGGYNGGFGGYGGGAFGAFDAFTSLFGQPAEVWQ